MLTKDDVRPYVESVLKATDNCLSSYQILNRLPAEIRDQVIKERGWPGAGTGKSTTAATFVSQVAARVVPSNDPPHRIYIDCVGITFHVAGKTIQAGGPAIAFYRLRPLTSADTAEEQAEEV